MTDLLASQPASESVRCAIYTRKSIAVAADEQVNSLEAQREVCSAYIKCNGHLGWSEITNPYDDAGFSGATLERPALRRLLGDIENGLVDVVLFYKIDRLTRSLSDFVRLMDNLGRYEVSFVSVTQSFDTSSSMGRMVLNVLLTFAQFEREMLADRIRDKFESMRQQGLHVLGKPPLGYDKVDGRLLVNKSEAATVRSIFERVDQFPSLLALMKQLQAEGVTVKRTTTRAGRQLGGAPIHRGVIYGMLRNPLYIGYVSYKGRWYKGLHQPIVERALWDHVQAVQAERCRPKPPWDPGKNLLRGLICDEHDRKLFVREGGGPRHKFRFYQTAPKCPERKHYLDLIRVRADEVENLTFAALKSILADACRLRRILLSVGETQVDMHALAAQALDASNRFSRMSRPEIREFYEAVLVRVEVTKSELRLLLSTCELVRFCRWKGVGPFKPSTWKNVAPGRTYMVTINAHLIRAHRDFVLPLAPREGSAWPVNRGLVHLLQRAIAAHQTVMTERQEHIAVLARRFKLGPSKFARLLRLNYLAPDIQAAIMDGTQPSSLTVHDLMYTALPLDWEQQRSLLGFSGVSTCVRDVKALHDQGATIG